MLIGGLTLFGQAILPDALLSLANSGAVWSLIAFVLGRRARHWRMAAFAGFIALISESARYYIAAHIFIGDKMGKIVVINHLTLDGVMQGPGRPDEDTRGGFVHGGWATPHNDEAMGAKMGERMGSDFSFLFGRRTYTDLLASWNAQGGPFKDALNNTRKYVAASDPAARLDWPNSTLLHGDVLAAVRNLKERSSGNLVIMGSGVLTASLMGADLIDEYLLLIHPLLLGTGRRLFAGGQQAALRLVDSSTTTSGVWIATYEPARG